MKVTSRELCSVRSNLYLIIRMTDNRILHSLHAVDSQLLASEVPTQTTTLQLSAITVQGRRANGTASLVRPPRVPAL